MLASALLALAGAGAVGPVVTHRVAIGPAHVGASLGTTRNPALVPVPLPGRPTAALMATPTQGWLDAGDALYHSADGGRTWKRVFAHCAAAQMAGEPCGEPLTAMAELPDGTVLMASRQSSSVWSIPSAGDSAGLPLATLPGPVWEGPWVVAGSAFAAVEAAGPAARVPTAPVTLMSSPDGRRWTAIGRIPVTDPAAPPGVGFLAWVSVLGRDRWAVAYADGGCSTAWTLALTQDGGRRWQAVRPPLFGYGTWLATGSSSRRWLLGGPACGSGAPIYSQGLFSSTDAGQRWRPVSLRSGTGPVAPAAIRIAASGGVPAFRPVRGDLLVDLGAAAVGEIGAVAVGGYTAAARGSGVSASPSGTAGPATPDGADGALVLVSPDGGATWTVDSLPGFPALTLASCAPAGPCLLGSGTASTGWLLTRSSPLSEGAGALAGASVVSPPLTGIPSTATLTGVSCPTLDGCVVVGSVGSPLAAGAAPLVATWNGSGFARAAVPRPGSGGAGLTAVSCVTSASCVAVGSQDGGRRPLALVLGARGWVPMTVPLPHGAVRATLTAVACAPGHHCLAVGAWSRLARVDTGGTFAAGFDGRAWRSLPRPSLSPSGASGLACPGLDDCLVVGSTGPIGQARAAVNRWDGRRWLPEPVPSPSASSALSGIACLSPARCWAVGDAATSAGQQSLALTLAARTASWRVEATPDVSLGYDPLSSVGCVATGCLAIGQTWFRPSGPTHILLLSGGAGRWAVLPAYSPRWSGYRSAIACSRHGGTVGCLAVGSRQGPHAAFLPYAVAVRVRAADPARAHRFRIGPSAVWPDAWHDQVAAFSACAHPPAGERPCLESFMHRHGASAAAVSFFAATGRYLTAFVATGRVDLGGTAPPYPVSGGGGGIMLLNGRPPDLVPPLPSVATPAYARLRAAYRLPTGASALDILVAVPWLESARTQPDGRETIVVQYPINDQCSACSTPYRARVAYRFSATGAYVGLQGLGPCKRRLPGQPVGRVTEPACPATRPGVAG